MKDLLANPKWVKPFPRLALELLVMATSVVISSDASFSTVQAAGTLKVCVPHNYPPLSTSDAALPGLEVELVQAIAKQMNLKLQLSHNQSWELASLDQKANPQQCQLLTGGMVDGEFYGQQIETLPPSLEVGWAMVYSAEVANLKDNKVAVYAGFPGLDRLALSQYLKREGVQMVVVSSAEAFGQVLASGEVQIGITEAILARHLAAQNRWQVAWVPIPQAKYALRLLATWKGDWTLKKEVRKAVEAIERRGEMQKIFDRYKLAAISQVCAIC